MHCICCSEFADRLLCLHLIAGGFAAVRWFSATADEECPTWRTPCIRSRLFKVQGMEKAVTGDEIGAEAGDISVYFIMKIFFSFSGRGTSVVQKHTGSHTRGGD